MQQTSRTEGQRPGGADLDAKERGPNERSSPRCPKTESWSPTSQADKPGSLTEPCKRSLTRKIQAALGQPSGLGSTATIKDRSGPTWTRKWLHVMHADARTLVSRLESFRIHWLRCLDWKWLPVMSKLELHCACVRKSEQMVASQIRGSVSRLFDSGVGLSAVAAVATTLYRWTATTLTLWKDCRRAHASRED